MSQKKPARTASDQATHLTQRGWALVAGAAVSFIAAYTSGRHEFLFAACLLILLPLAAYLLVRTRKVRISAVRSFSPHIVPAGSATAVTIDLQNLGNTATPTVDASDVLPWRPFASAPGRLPSLAPRRPRFARASATRLSYDLAVPRRGRYEIGPLALDHGDPFGLARGAGRVGESQELVVIPGLVDLPESGLSIQAGDGSARLIQRRATGNDDDLMTREYRMGDALRRVHWRASARHGELMVRQEEQRTYPEARIILDTNRTGYHDASTDPPENAQESEAFDWAVDMVASVGVHLHRAGFLVHMIETGPARIEPLADAAQWTGRDEDFLVSLATIRLCDPPVDDVTGRRLGNQGVEGSLGPVFAIVGSPEVATVKWLAKQRRPYELAVVFVRASSGASIDYIEGMFGTAPKYTSTIDFLENAGWIVVPVRAFDTPASAWLSVMDEAGVIIRDPA